MSRSSNIELWNYIGTETCSFCSKLTECLPIIEEIVACRECIAEGFQKEFNEPVSFKEAHELLSERRDVQSFAIQVFSAAIGHLSDHLTRGEILAVTDLTLAEIKRLSDNPTAKAAFQALVNAK